MIDHNGLFQYGTTTSYGSTTAPQSKSGNTYQNILANISGLMAGTTFIIFASWRPTVRAPAMAQTKPLRHSAQPGRLWLSRIRQRT